MAVCTKVYGRHLHSKQSLFSLNVYVIKYTHTHPHTHTHTHTHTHWSSCRPLTDTGGVVVRLHSFLTTSPDEEVVVRLTPPPFFRRRYMPHYEFKMRLGGPDTSLGSSQKRKYLLFLPRIVPDSLVVQPLV